MKICNEGAQYNIVQTHKIKDSDLSHVNNISFAYIIFQLILKYNMFFEKWWRKHYASLKDEKPLRKVYLNVSLSVIPG